MASDDCIVIDGQIISIESKEEFVSRMIAEQNEDTKIKQIARNQEQAKELNRVHGINM